MYIGQRFNGFKVIYTENKHTDHKELKRTLVKLGINAGERARFHEILKRCHYGIVTPEELMEGNKLFKYGFDFHRYIPIKYRKNWIEQPD